MYSQKHAYLSEDPTVLSKQHNWSQSLASNNVVIKSSLQNVLPMKRKDMAVLSWHTVVILYYRYYTLIRVWEAKDKQYALDWIRLTHSPSTWRWLETYKTKWKIYNHSDESMVKYIPRNQGLVFCAKSTSSVLFNWSENTSDGNISAQSITCGTGGKTSTRFGKGWHATNICKELPSCVESWDSQVELQWLLHCDNVCLL